MKNNVGEALLIISIIFVIITQSLKWYSWIAVIILFSFAIGTWEIVPGKKARELTEILIEKTKLEIQLMKAQTQWYVAQGALIMKNLGRG